MVSERGFEYWSFMRIPAHYSNSLSLESLTFLKQDYNVDLQSAMETK